MIELDGLGRDYGEREVLAGLSLTIPAGSTLTVFGPNGAGKTTLLRVLAGLLRPTRGRATVCGEELPAQAYALRGRVGLLAHESLLYDHLTARENLGYYARLYDVAGERVDELLSAVGLGSRADEPLRTLSRGMVQRVAIARSVLHRPELLLLDEPYANLDPAARELVEPLIGPTPSTTRVFTSHDPGELNQADFVLGLRNGRPAIATAAETVNEAAIRELYQ